MTSREILEEARMGPAAAAQVAGFHRGIVGEVQSAIAAHDVVVVGMKQNPFPKKARKLLREAGIAHHYLEYGSYLSGWRERLAIKMWSGFPTFPQVFVKGTLIGGASDLEKELTGGALQDRLAGGRQDA